MDHREENIWRKILLRVLELVQPKCHRFHDGSGLI